MLAAELFSSEGRRSANESSAAGASAGTRATKSTATRVPEKMPNSSLPELTKKDEESSGWTKHVDESTGKPFYYNKKSRKSVWRLEGTVSDDVAKDSSDNW